MTLLAMMTWPQSKLTRIKNNHAIKIQWFVSMTTHQVEDKLSPSRWPPPSQQWQTPPISPWPASPTHRVKQRLSRSHIWPSPSKNASQCWSRRRQTQVSCGPLPFFKILIQILLKICTEISFHMKGSEDQLLDEYKLFAMWYEMGHVLRC